MMVEQVPRTRHELDNLFAQSYAAIKRSEPVPVEQLDLLSQSISLLSIFSENEEFDDVDTADVGLALVDYWLACAILKKPTPMPLNPATRKSAIQQSQAYFERFLARCTVLDIFTPASRSGEAGEGRKLGTTTATREEKIARFQKLKALRQQLEGGGGSGLDIRGVWRARLEVACLETLDEFDGIERELQVLDYMIKMQEEGGGQSAAAAAAAEPIVNKPIEVTRVGPDLVMHKETFQKGVFKPFHRQPTISLEQFAEMEMQRMEQEAQRKRDAPPSARPVLSLNELHEQGLEDDGAQMDAAIDKARKWDDWKDTVPKGSGVTKRL